jgi:uncharacterized protein with HEPN domain
MKDDTVYLRHILEAIDKIEGYVAGFGYETFSQENKTIDAVVRELEIIGEAASNISDTFKKRHPEIPLQEAVDMRNRLIHEYFGVNLKIVWTTVVEDLPKLKTALEETVES